MLDRREAIASIAAIAGAGATCQAVEQKPNEPKVLFYVLKLPESCQDPSDQQIDRIKENISKTIGGAPVLVIPAGCEFLKCTELPNVPELQTATRSWWRKALGL